MKFSLFNYSSIALLFTFVNCEAQSVEKGITEELAIWRKKEVYDIKYKLYFHIPASTQNITVKEEINFDLTTNSKNLQIDFKTNPKQIRKLIVNGKSIKPYYFNEHLVIDPVLLHKKNNQITIDFVSSGRSIIKDTSGLVYCFFVPANARESFACFDQPDLKAVFDLTLTVPNGWLVISNGIVLKNTKGSINTTWQFEETKRISTYLFSFAAGKFKKYPETREGRTINFYYRETQQSKLDSSLKRCMDINFKALAFNIDYIGCEYPFQKFDFVEIPRFGVSGMEHPGAIFYKGSMLFLDNASAGELYERNRTIGHEVSHMWFGDLVTMKWFNEVWLKEVFANYLGDKFVNTQSPDSSSTKKFLLGNFPNAYQTDRYPSSNPILQELPNLDQAGLVYGNITYNKTPIMIHQLELLLGEENFRKGLQDYIRTYKWGNADFSQLVEQFKKYSNKNLDSWLNAWAKTQGRPVFNYSIDTSNGIITRFSLIQHGEYDNKQTLPQQFEIMLFYDENNKQTIKINMVSETQNITEVIGKKPPLFILFNTSGEGYGVFPCDKAFVETGMHKASVVARAAAVINLYELMLQAKEEESGNSTSVYKLGPKEMLHLLCSLISWEPDRQLLERELKYISFIYWKLLKPNTRHNTTQSLEKSLLDAIKQQTGSNKTSIFRTYMQIAETPFAVESLYNYWDKRSAPEAIKLGSSDWTEIASQLALRNYHTKEVLNRELDSLKDYEAHKSFLFKMKALTSNVNERDSLFKSFLNYEGRKDGDNVISALSILHHPLRQTESRKYLQKSLEILPEILHTNDVFFVSNWISAILGSYQDFETSQTLRLYFSKNHPDVPYLLLQKLKQNADWVFRAEAVAE